MTKRRPVEILVVEDEAIIAMDTTYVLESLGYRVSAIALTGESAIRKADETEPDLVLMDITLGEDRDGIETAREIREGFGIPVIYVTANEDEGTLERIKETSPYGYILKPFEGRELHTTIQVALYKHRLEKKVREETENSLATILGGAELIIEDGSQGHDRETLRRVEGIRTAANLIGKIIKKL